jgi:NAD+ synthase
MEPVTDLLVRFIKDGVVHSGFERAVVGVSGGVDSAVVATLAAKALGPSNVLGVLMPHRQSSATATDDAKAVVAATGIRQEMVDITPIVDGFISAAGSPERVRLGNVMARTRMVVLYDRSARDGALVLGTSNKTELMLGYGTLHGDLASALNPIGDLYKTYLWQLAEFLGVPERIVNKAPTADLWEGQTDEGELGFSYREADRLLYLMVDERRTDDELAAAGFSPELIAKVRDRVRRFQFKRRPPVIAKIGQRTVNVDFRYPRDWGL